MDSEKILEKRHSTFTHDGMKNIYLTKISRSNYLVRIGFAGLFVTNSSIALAASGGGIPSILLIPMVLPLVIMILVAVKHKANSFPVYIGIPIYLVLYLFTTMSPAQSPFYQNPNFYAIVFILLLIVQVVTLVILVWRRMNRL